MSDRGVWLVWYTDWHAFVHAIFDDEMEARRYADVSPLRSILEVGFFPFGEWKPFDPSSPLTEGKDGTQAEA